MFGDKFRCSEYHISFLQSIEMQKLHIPKIRAVWKPNFQWIIWEVLPFFCLKVLNQNKRPGTYNF